MFYQYRSHCADFLPRTLLSAICRRGSWYTVLTAPTSGGAATIAMGVDTDDADGILAATAYDAAAFGVGPHDGIPCGSAASFAGLTSDRRNVILTIAGAPLTAGKIQVYWEYITQE